MGTKKLFRVASSLILMMVGSVMLSQSHGIESNYANGGIGDNVGNVPNTRSLLSTADNRNDIDCNGQSESSSTKKMLLSQFLSKIPVVGQHFSSSLHHGRKLCKCALDSDNKSLSKLRALRRNDKPLIAGFVFPAKTGIGSVTRSFIEAFRCRLPLLEKYSMLGGLHFTCTDENKHLFRTHSMEEASRSMEAYQRDTPPNRQCLIVTSIRDPQTRLASIFMEQRKTEVCTNEWVSSHTPQELLEDYQRWLINSRATRPHPTPDLLNEFGSKSLSEAWDELNTNVGYATISHPLSSKEGETTTPATTNSGNNNDNSETTTTTTPSAFENCELLLLRMEDSEHWNHIVELLVPAVNYKRHTSLELDCPMITEHYKTLKEYTFTQDELQAMVDKDPWNEEYFRLYGHDAPSPTEEEDQGNVIQTTATTIARTATEKEDQRQQQEQVDTASEEKPQLQQQEQADTASEAPQPIVGVPILDLARS